MLTGIPVPEPLAEAIDRLNDIVAAIEARETRKLIEAIADPSG